MIYERNNQTISYRRKISRIRELKDMKQEALAQALGTHQQAISAIENSENIDEEKLKEVAKVLGVTVEAIKNFSEENVINYLMLFTIMTLVIVMELFNQIIVHSILLTRLSNFTKV